MQDSIASPTFVGFAQHLVNSQLLDSFVTQQLITESQQESQPFILYLAGKNYLPPDKLAEEIAGFFHLPLFNPANFDHNQAPIKLVKAEQLQQQLFLPLRIEDNYLHVGLIDPSSDIARELRFMTQMRIKLHIIAFNKLKQLIDDIANLQLHSALANFNENKLHETINQQNHQQENLLNLENNTDQIPVISFINKVLVDAINRHASDIHFEPYEHSYRIRFRQDGLLTEYRTIPHNVARYFVARLKVVSHLDLSEQRLPQDGRCQLSINNTQHIDFRISTLPMLWGEKNVLRILQSTPEQLSIDRLGLNQQQQQLLRNAINNPQGLILVTGPTGSGKTVTLYSALSELNKTEKNISTIEDPVEIDLFGINQVAVNRKTGLTFSPALRALMRQDPDIIMVGEIRDLETAEIATRAAQTGHLVLSTLHTNSAAETIIRLTNMGMAAHNLISSITLIIAQRLVRRLCRHCKTVKNFSTLDLKQFNYPLPSTKNPTIYQANGCQRCINGYTGRIGIYEALPMTEALQQLILDGCSVHTIQQQAKQNNLLTLTESALNHVYAGITSLDEIKRVINTAYGNET